MTDPVAPQANAAASKRICLLDADPLIRNEVAEALVHAGFAVDQYGDLATGVAGILRNRPDLIVMDLHFRVDMDGVALVRRLRDLPGFQELPIIFLSGERDKNRVVAALQTGARDFLIKQSYTRKVLVGRARAALGMPPEEEALRPAATAVAAPVVKNTREGRRTAAYRPDVDEIKRAIRSAAEVRALPQVASEVVRLTRSPEVDAKALRTVIESDPSLASRVLQVANSVHYRRQGNIQTIDRAIMTLGFRTIRQLVVSVTVVKEVLGSENYLDRARLWRHGLYSAVLGRNILARRDRDLAEEAFLGCLLHDIGMALLDDFFPQFYKEAIDLARKVRRPLRDTEEEVLGLSHCAVGRIAATSWSLPSEIVAMIGLHHTPWDELQKNGGEALPFVGVCQAANALANAYGITANDISVLDFVPDDIPPMSDMQTADVLTALQDAQGQMQELAGMLLSGRKTAPLPERPPSAYDLLAVAPRPGWRFALAALVSGDGVFRPVDASTLEDGLKNVQPRAVIAGPFDSTQADKFVPTLETSASGLSGTPVLVLVQSAVSEDVRKRIAATSAEVLALPVPLIELRAWLAKSAAACGAAPVQASDAAAGPPDALPEAPAKSS